MTTKNDTDSPNTSNVSNGALRSRRWQPRPEMRDDLPLWPDDATADVVVTARSVFTMELLNR